MNVLLLRSPKGTLIPLVEAVQRSPNADGHGSGWWGRSKARIFSTYESLKEKLDYYEKVCADLRGAQRLKIVHPSRWSADEAEGLLQDFLESRRGHHLRWFQVDVVLAILGGFLMPLPGPNLFFFYPAARAFGHYHARQGAAAALQCRPWAGEADRRLDQVEKNLSRLEDISSTLSELEERYGVAHLKKSLEALRKR
ncbi:MAG TPA: hypothetical protein VLU25_03995 [Acidobacteriota bacterium]|nr:hypothetical protein [Acidobacteriota bacterium]